MLKHLTIGAGLVALALSTAIAQQQEVTPYKIEPPIAGFGHSIEINERFVLHDAWISDADGFSRTAREQITGSALYFVAHIERPNGSEDPDYGTQPRGVFVFTTTSGRHVLRLIELPANEFSPRTTDLAN